MVAHSCFTVAPVKLEDFSIHYNLPGISGSLVEGRVVYDAMCAQAEDKTLENLLSQLIDRD